MSPSAPPCIPPPKPQELVFLEDISACTLEVIVAALLGDAAEGALEELLRFVPVLTSSLVSVPFALPWPLSRVQIFSFGRGMDARKRILKVRCQPRYPHACRVQ